MYNFLVVWDKSVTDAEEAMITNAVNECTDAFPNCFFHIYGDKEIRAGSSMDMAVAFAMKRGEQVDAYGIVRYFEKLRSTFMPSAKLYTIAITSQDLYPEGDGLNFCFGMQSAHVIVQSLARYRHLPHDWLKNCIAHVMVHEMGHMFGAAFDRPENMEEVSPLYRHHCEEDTCVMHQVVSVDELTRSLSRTKHGKNRFCLRCRMDMAFKLGATIMRIPSKSKVY